MAHLVRKGTTLLAITFSHRLLWPQLKSVYTRASIADHFLVDFAILRLDEKEETSDAEHFGPAVACALHSVAIGSSAQG